MQGEPLSQARRAIEACLGVLSEADSFGLVVFDNEAAAFQPALAPGTRESRDKAREFLAQVSARGGTELAGGFLEAAKLLEREGGDILIFTDGQVSGTEKILAEARSAGVRLHCLGIGSASQDRFLALLARETGGVSRFVTPRERVDLAAVDLFASVGRPVASGLKVGVNVQPEPPGLVFGGTPVLLFGDAGQSGENQIELNWNGGRLCLPVHFSQSEIAETVWLLQGSRLITDWESRYPSAEALASVEKRTQSRAAARLLALSQTYGLASREMSLVAVVTRLGDRPDELPETRVVPVGMPQNTAFGAYFPDQAMLSMLTPRLGLVTSFKGLDVSEVAGLPKSAGPFNSLRSRLIKRFGSLRPHEPELRSEKAPVDYARAARTPEDILLDLASRLDSDGGMPGKDRESRAVAAAVTLLAFLSQGHTATQGAFRSHVARLVEFLKSLTGLSSHHQKIIDAVIDLARKGAAPAGKWMALARTSGDHWEEVGESVLNTR
jgi:Ca-activated chloride channel family protein